VSLGLVATLGFLLIISLVISAAISVFGEYLNTNLPFADIILAALSELIALVLIAALFAAIYKILPDRHLSWHDVGVGAVVTAILFTAGKSLIGWYLGSSAVASSYGAASALILALLWVYYSSLIFLFGAEITRAYSIRRGSHCMQTIKFFPRFHS
jgi:membrane protein